ncbi:132_t:CDS:1, partial [Rhizophagus irregularis]
AKSKRTVGIVERYNHTLVEKLFPSQDASDLLTLGKMRSQVWVKNLPIAVESINNSVTQQLGISPAVAIKKLRVSSRSS